MGKGEWAGANSLMTPQAQVEAYNTYVEKYLLLLLLEMCQKLSITTRHPEVEERAVSPLWASYLLSEVMQ